MSEKRPINEGSTKRGGQNKPPVNPRPSTPPTPQKKPKQ